MPAHTVAAGPPCRIADTHDPFLPGLVSGVPDKFAQHYTDGVPEARVAYYAYAAIMLANRVGSTLKLPFGGRKKEVMPFLMPKLLKEPTPAWVMEALSDYESVDGTAPMISTHANCLGVINRCMLVSRRLPV